MFDSQCILSSKGPFGSIWVAGYFFKRLKKRQIYETDIPSSVDKILLDGLPSVTYRVLAYLLLGVVRIHSKKAEFLYEDCDQAVSDINKFSLSKKDIPFRVIVRPFYTISLPERYELDTFQLEVTDEATREHVSQKEDIVLRDMDKDISEQYSLGKDRFEEDPLHREELDNAQASFGISIQQNASSSVQTPEKLSSDKEPSTLDHTPPDCVLSPEVEVGSPNHMKYFELSKEKLREMRFTQDEGCDADMICELDVELLNLVNDYESENPVDGNKDIREKMELKNLDKAIAKEDKAPSPAEKTSGTEVTDVAAASTRQFALVPTPVKQENLRRSNKRRCIFDDTTTLTNEAMKQSINDASALVCKRRKAPHTVLDLWRVNHIPVLFKNFKEPLIPWLAMEIGNIQCGKKIETQQSFNLAPEPIQTEQIPEKEQVTVSPRTAGDSRPEIAPGTPVRCSTSARVFGNARGEDSDGEAAPSYDNIKKNFVQEEEDIGPRLMDEMDANDEGDNLERRKNKDGWSTRTRTVAKYLHRVYQEKKQQGEEAVTLLPIVKSKTKAETARLFFEILVLSTGGFMKVNQQKAYEDVILEETSKMRAASLKT